MKRFNDLSDYIVKELKISEGILDGEIVALDGAGRPSVLRLNEAPIRSGLLRLRYYLVERARPSGRVAAGGKRFSEMSSRVSLLGSDV